MCTLWGRSEVITFRSDETPESFNRFWPKNQSNNQNKLFKIIQKKIGKYRRNWIFEYTKIRAKVPKRTRIQINTAVKSFFPVAISCKSVKFLVSTTFLFSTHFPHLFFLFFYDSTTFILHLLDLSFWYYTRKAYQRLIWCFFRKIYEI